MIGVPFEEYDEVRVGIVGVGSRGYHMLDRFLAVPQVRITAIADAYEPRAHSAAARVVAAGQAEPAVYAGGEVSYEAAPDAAYEAALEASRRAGSEQPADHHNDYRGLCARDDVDFVFTAGPWEWHHPVAMAAMRAGKHVGVELPLAMELGHLWELVDTSERTRRHCIQVENVSYGRTELRLLRMVHAGLLGELTYGAGGYIHDLRHNLFARPNRDSTELGVLYRRAWHARLDGCLYPNHGLAPIAAYMDINRGDRFTTLTSFSTPSRGLEQYRDQHVPPDHPAWADGKYVAGDRNISLLETAKGRRVRLEHDVTSPHPATRINYLAGTRGVFEESTHSDHARVYVETDLADHQWRDAGQYTDYEHWLWTDIGEQATEQGGHGGMDYMLVWRLVQTMRLGLVPDIDVYDSATWSAPLPLSAHSLKQGSNPVNFPDFIRDSWRSHRPGLDTTRSA